MASHFSRYRVDLESANSIRDALTKIVRDLDLRVGANESAVGSFEQARQQLINEGLRRINEVLLPAFEHVQEYVDFGFAECAIDPEFPVDFVDGNQTLRLASGTQRDLFQPGPFLILTRTSDASDYAVAQRLSFDRGTGALVVDILTVTGGGGTVDDVIVSSAPGSYLAQQPYLAAAQDAETGAAAARDAAEGFKTTASTQAGIATTQAGLAADHKAAAAGFAGTAADEADDAENAAAAAEAFRDQAEEWATKTGGPVEGGEYSAKQYALDAAESAAAASAVSGVEIASQEVAEAGESNAVFMSPLRTAQNITARLASTEDAEAGTNDSKLMTPERTAQAIAQLAPKTIARIVRTSNTALGHADGQSLIDITSGTFTQTFDPCADLGDGWWVYLRNAGSGDITLDPDGSEEIDGLTSYIIYPGECRLIQCDGTKLTSVLVTAGSRVFTTSENFVWPPGISGLVADVIGASAGGRRPNTTSFSSHGGGGGGRLILPVPVQAPGTVTAVTVGAAGVGSTTNNTNGTSGGNSSFGSFAIATGGLNSGSGGAQMMAHTSSISSHIAVNSGGAGVSSDGGPTGSAEWGGGASVTGANIAAGSSIFGGAAGGPGGAPGAASGAGGRVGSITEGGGGSAAAGVSSGTPNNGGNGANGTNGFCGAGGGGGGGNADGTGGNGGNGGIPGGGGGGGGCGSTSGNGGNGARGEIRITMKA